MEFIPAYKTLLPETAALVISGPRHDMIGKVLILKRYVKEGEVIRYAGGDVKMPFSCWECVRPGTNSRRYHKADDLCPIDANLLTISERRAYMELNRETFKRK